MRYLFVFVLLFFQKSNIFAKYVNVNDFGVYKTGIWETDHHKKERWSRLNKLFLYCIKNGFDIYFPKGIYDVGARNFPFRALDGSKTLLNCNNITIFGEGLNTVLMTTSERGADVLQLNMVTNLKIKNFLITANQTALNHSGSNGISITYGWNNIVLENIKCYNLPGVDKGSWIDGGKALTIQFDDDKKNLKGKIIAKGIISVNNAYGFRFDGLHVNEITRWNPQIEVDIYVDRAYQGISIAFGSPSELINFDKKLDLIVNANIVNAQQSVIMARVIGGKFKYNITNTMEFDQRRRDLEGNYWVRKDFDDFTFLGQAPQNVEVKLNGNVGNVKNMIWLGAVGHVTEKYNFINKTQNSVFDITLAGIAKNYFLVIDDDFGNNISNSTFLLNNLIYQHVISEKKIVNNNTFKKNDK